MGRDLANRVEVLEDDRAFWRDRARALYASLSLANALLRRAVAHHTNDTETPMWVTEARQLLGEIDNAADAAGGQDE